MIYQNTFNSINEFLSRLDKDAQYPLEASNKDNGSSWCDTKSYNEAYQNVKFSKNENIDMNVFSQINKEYDSIATKQKFRKDVVGSLPIVANYVSGNPRQMFRKVKVEKKSKILNIAISSGALGGVSSEKIIKNAINNFKIIKILENKGYRCNVYMLYLNHSLLKSPDDGSILRIKIKNASERFNITKMVNPLCSSSFYRRCVFRYYEVEFKDKLDVFGYGSSKLGGEKYLGSVKNDFDYILPNANTVVSITDDELKNNFDNVMQRYCISIKKNSK